MRLRYIIATLPVVGLVWFYPADDSHANSFYGVLETGVVRTSGDATGFNISEQDGNTNGYRIEGTVGTETSDQIFSSQSGNTRIELDVGYQRSKRNRTDTAQGGERIHNINGSPSQLESVNSHVSRSQYEIQALDAGVKLKTDFAVSDKTTISPHIGAGAAIMRQKFSMDQQAQGAASQTLLKEQLTTRMVGASVGATITSQLSERTKLKAGVGLSVYSTNSYLGAEQDPFNFKGIKQSARAESSGVATRSQFELGIDHQVTDKFSVGVKAKVDYWDGVSTIENPSSDGEAVKIGNDGKMLNYSVGVSGEVKF